MLTLKRNFDNIYIQTFLARVNQQQTGIPGLIQNSAHNQFKSGMMNSNKNDGRLSEFQTALQNLRESEKACAVAAAQYAELESIIRKQLKTQFVEGTDSPSKTESNTSCKTDCRSVSSFGSGSKYSFKSTKKTVTRLPSKIQNKNESSDKLVKKSTTDVGTASPEPSQKSQLLKRIRQCHDSVDDVATLSEKNISERTKFLARLHKSNKDSWKTQKARHPILEKLEMQLEKK